MDLNNIIISIIVSYVTAKLTYYFDNKRNKRINNIRIEIRENKK